jgi:hypothetical protein
MFHNYLNYSDAFLDSLSPEELKKIAENCFASKTKHYEVLAKVVPKMGYTQSCVLRHAVELLEDAAVEVILDNYDLDNMRDLENYGTEGVMRMLWIQAKYFNQKGLPMREKREKIATIAKLLFEHKQEVTKGDLEMYSQVATLEDLISVLKNSSTPAPSSILEHYYSVDLEPLHKGLRYSSIEDVLLMRSYSKDKSEQDIRQIYSNLLNSSKVASDIMHLAAINIINGDDLKIIFSNNTGMYLPLRNIIYSGGFDGFSTESIVIHELGHYALFSIFPGSNGAPFETSRIDLQKTTQDDIYGYYLNTKGSMFTEELHGDTDKFFQYEKGAKQVIVKAGEMLGLNNDELAPYLVSKDFIHFFKDNTFIDLFLDNFELRNNATTLHSLSRKTVFAEALLSYQKEGIDGVCVNSTVDLFYNQGQPEICPTNCTDVSWVAGYDKVVEFVQIHYFPYIIERFSVNKEEMRFLERVADLVGQARDFYECAPSPERFSCHIDCYYNGYYRELIVRYAELKADDASPEILSAFSGLTEYWQDNISPIIEEARVEYLSGQPSSLDFSYPSV